MLGSIQLITYIRNSYPQLHRWLGRLYVGAAIITAIGGLSFIITRGTIGGIPMDIAFAGYGLLTLIAAIAAISFARAQKFERHRAWAIRLYALAIGSWLYRMYYGFWFLFTGGVGHTQHFDGPFDVFMNFFFYLPNLLVAEIFIGRYKALQNSVAKSLATAGMFTASTFLLLATYFFTKQFWLPSMVQTWVNFHS
jgi:uncharacterized membrane protein